MYNRYYKYLKVSWLSAHYDYITKMSMKRFSSERRTELLYTRKYESTMYSFWLSHSFLSSRYSSRYILTYLSWLSTLFTGFIQRLISLKPLLLRHFSILSITRLIYVIPFNSTFFNCLSTFLNFLPLPYCLKILVQPIILFVVYLHTHSVPIFRLINNYLWATPL